ncbi:hypothetical protein [Dyadobacter tibetensis]|uniref:hypothetical protein n=1 Tax=Dyadobacter tibetensis TaxID=1211851 RepID=UPI00046EED88|nr:hypothetical protein [Dyadobacter tibetensis]
MKNITYPLIFIAVLLAAARQQAFAQFQKGDKLLNIGLGVGNYENSAPFHASFEYAFGNYFSAGVQTDVYSYRYGPGDAYRTSFPTALRASYHYGKHFVRDKRLDLYGGAALGILSASHYDRWPDRHPKHFVGDGGGPTVGLYAGAKYLFTPGFGLFAEAGHNISWLKLGVAFRF